MKVATLGQGPAVIQDEAAYLLPISVLQLVELGLERALEIGADAVRSAPITFLESDLLLPYKPPSVRDFVTFESHVEGVRRSIDNATGVPEVWYDAQHFYFTNPHALYGPGQAIPRPVTCRALDFEMEVGVVVGHELRLANQCGEVKWLKVTRGARPRARHSSTIASQWSSSASSNRPSSGSTRAHLTEKR